MKIDDSTFFLKKWVKICLTICILKSFFIFEDFKVEVTRQITLVNSGEMQSSSSGSIKRTRSIFFFEAVEQKCLIPPSMTLFFS